MLNREVNGRLIYLKYERCYGAIVDRMGTYFTKVKFVKNGVEYEVLVENDEFEFVSLEDLVEYDDE